MKLLIHNALEGPAEESKQLKKQCMCMKLFHKYLKRWYDSLQHLP